MKNVAFTTGGTGGHIYPALALAKEMEKKEYNIVFIGTKHRMEKDIVPKNNFKFYGLDILPIKSIKAVFKLFKATIESIKILKENKIDIVIGFGNYISIPTLIAAKLLRKTIYLQEQNILMGQANKLFYRFSKKTFLAFNETLNKIVNRNNTRKFKCPCVNKLVVTGNPLREEFYNINKKDAREILGISENEKVILIMGGSLGAKNINKAVIDNIELINKKNNLTVYWSTGESLYKETCSVLKDSKNIIVMPYFENVFELMAASDLIVSRAGASTISEILELEKPTIFIPYDYVGQKENAEMLEYVNGAKSYTNENSSQAIKEALSLIDQNTMLEFMANNIKSLKTGNAVKNIINIIEEEK